MIWAAWYMLCGVTAVVICLFRNIHRTYIYVMLTNIALTIIFICVLLFFTVGIFVAALVTVILVMLSIGAIPIAYSHLEGNMPGWVKIIVATVIGAGVIGISVAGWATNVVSDFAVFTFLMGALFVVFFLVASAMYL